MLGQGTGRRGEELVHQANLFPDILKIGDGGDGLEGVDQVVQLALFDELVGGEYALHAGQLAGGLEVADA